MKIFVPPIKCQGIKTKLVPWIIENIKIEPEGRWIEPFMGSGVVGFNVRPKAALFYDLNPHIINFYNDLKYSRITPNLVKEYLEVEGKNLNEKGGEYFYEIRERFNKNNKSLDFLFLSRSCFNGVMRFNRKGFFNVPFCKKNNRFAKPYITKIVNQVNYIFEALKMYDWKFECADFKNAIVNSNTEDFIYCDPPYFGRHVDYFNSWSEDDEYNLSRLLKETKSKFILSTWYKNIYRENEMIEKYWREFFILTKDHFYHIGGKEENRNPMIEALILNFEPDDITFMRTSFRQHAFTY